LDCSCEPIPKPTPKKRGVLFLSPEDMQEAKKSMKEKGIKAEDVKNLPPIEEIHGLNIPPVEETYDLNSLFIRTSWSRYPDTGSKGKFSL